jgi:lysozyme
MYRFFIGLLLLLLPLVLNQKGSEAFVRVHFLQGVDVSHYQKRIMWDTVAASKQVDFAFVKATEAHDYQDSLFCDNWEALGRLGIRRGAYHFFRAYGCGAEQARLFLNTVEMRPGDLAPVLDIERLDGIPPEIMREEAQVWLQIVERQLGIKPIIYSNQHFFDLHLAGHFDHYPLWVARYSDDAPRLLNGKNWDIWQYSNVGAIQGIPTDVDMNVFPGNKTMFERLCWRPAATENATAMP